MPLCKDWFSGQITRSAVLLGSNLLADGVAVAVAPTNGQDLLDGRQIAFRERDVRASG